MLCVSSVPLQHEMGLLVVLLEVKVDCTLGCYNDDAGCGVSSPGTLWGAHLSREGSL